MATQTPNYNLQKPELFADTDLWGGMWNSNADILDTELKANADAAAAALAAAIPVGCIVMWSGSVATIPTGWALCDGTGGTPNLIDRFVIGAEADTPTTGKAPNTSGGGTGTTIDPAGSHSHTVTVDGHALTTAEMPSHTHRLNTRGNASIGGNESTTVSAGNTSGLGIGYTDIAVEATGSGNAHTHTANSDTEADHVHTATTDDPAWYALAYIQKVS